MKKRKVVLKHEFVENIPDNLEEKTIYVSITFSTAVHKCFCGCGNEVITPLSPTDWWLIFDGQSVTLSPSIGNWNFPCKSHYWIKRNKIEWAPRWSQRRIEAARSYDLLSKERYFKEKRYIDGVEPPTTYNISEIDVESDEGKPNERFWRKLKKYLKSVMTTW